MSALATLPNPATASLPQTYTNACTALAECARIDECQDWADKAAALASYAKQSEDDQLEKMALRIRSRAIRRAGELLKQIEPQQGKRNDKLNDGAVSKFTRTDAARDAGMSERQQNTALRVATVPQEDFDRQVESDKPPTLSQLASQGIKPRAKEQSKPLVDLQGRDPNEFNRALHFVGDLEDAARDLGALKIIEIVETLSASERARVKKAVSAIDAVTDQIITRIPV